MGISGLAKLLADNAPGSIKNERFNNYFGRKVAVDASMSIYQFLIVVGRIGTDTLTNEAGEVTSHLSGMFFRTARMLEAGIKPVYVFDGTPPQLKKEQLERRHGRREEATEALQRAVEEEADQSTVEKYSKRTARVTAAHNDDCKRLLTLMGVPVVEAPSEAEAQCSVMCRDGLVYGVASEDMDSLTFGAPRLLRHLMAPSSQQQNTIVELDRAEAVRQLGLMEKQFVDLCILCGCDYCNNIRGIGPVRALQLIQKYGSIEGVLENLDPSKYQVPNPYPYLAARALFQSPQVLPSAKLPPFRWRPADEEGLVEFLVKEKNFNEDRIRKAVQRVNQSKGKSNQGRLEQFFGPSIPIKVNKAPEAVKRKAAPASGKKQQPVGAAKKSRVQQS